MDADIVYDGSTGLLEKIMKIYPNVRVLCPKCGSEMKMAFDWTTAAKLKIHPGIYCSKDWKHMFTMIELAAK